MAVDYDVLASETTYTAAPDSTAGVSMQTKGAAGIEAILRVTAIGGSADQVLTVRPQHSIGATGPWEHAGSHLAFVVPGTGSIIGVTFPLRVRMRFAPVREYLRWNFVHTGTTLSMTYGLEVIYRSDSPSREAIWADAGFTATITTGADATVFGPWPIMGLPGWSLVARNSGANPLTAHSIQVSNLPSFPPATIGDWFVIDTSMAALAAGASLGFRSQDQSYRWLRIRATSAVATTLNHDFFGTPL